VQSASTVRKHCKTFCSWMVCMGLPFRDFCYRRWPKKTMWICWSLPC